MASFFSFLKNKKILPKNVVKNILLKWPLTLSKGLFVLGFLGILMSVYLILITLHDRALISIPKKGGVVKIGVLGNINSLNPLDVKTEVERSISPLVFPGLIKEVNGEIKNELSESFEVSNNEKEYIFKLKSDQKKYSINAQDVLYTYKTLKDEKVSHPIKSYLSNIENIEIIDSNNIKFILKEKTDISQIFSLGIIKESDLDKDYQKIISTGSYKINKVVKENNLSKKLILKRNKKYQGEPANIKKIEFIFFSNESDLIRAINKNKIDVTFDISTNRITEISKPDVSVDRIQTNIKYSIYVLNNSNGSLKKTEFVTLLNTALDKENIISIVENGYGKVNTKDEEQRQESINKIIANFKKENISIASANDSHNKNLADKLNESLNNLNINANVQYFDQGFFYQNIKDRNFSTIITKNENIPTAYKEVVDLYYKEIPIILNKEVINITPLSIKSPTDKYLNINNWYIRKQKIYWWNNN